MLQLWEEEGKELLSDHLLHGQNVRLKVLDLHENVLPPIGPVERPIGAIAVQFTIRVERTEHIVAHDRKGIGYGTRVRGLTQRNPWPRWWRTVIDCTNEEKEEEHYKNGSLETLFFYPHH